MTAAATRSEKALKKSVWVSLGYGLALVYAFVPPWKGSPWWAWGVGIFFAAHTLLTGVYVLGRTADRG